MTIVVTPENRDYKLAPYSDEILFEQPVTIDWGDGEVSSYNKLSSVKHRYKSIKSEIERNIIIHNPEVLKDITFKGDKHLKEVKGVLTTRFMAREFFKGCVRLVYVDSKFFKNVCKQTDLTSTFENCIMYKSGTLPLEVFDKIEIADKLFRHTNLISNELKKFNFDVFHGLLSGEYMLSDNYLTDISFIPINSFKVVVSLKGMMSGNPLINSAIPRVQIETLEVLDEFLIDSPNVIIDKNWLYYLSTRVKTNFNNIFHPSVVVNGRR